MRPSSQSNRRVRASSGDRANRRASSDTTKRRTNDEREVAGREGEREVAGREGERGGLQPSRGLRELPPPRIIGEPPQKFVGGSGRGSSPPQKFARESGGRSPTRKANNSSKTKPFRKK